METISFGNEHIEHVVRVYVKGDKVGIVKRQEDKDKWVWLPGPSYRDKAPFMVLESELQHSKNLVHKILCSL